MATGNGRPANWLQEAWRELGEAELDEEYADLEADIDHLEEWAIVHRLTDPHIHYRAEKMIEEEESFLLLEDANAES